MPGIETLKKLNTESVKNAVGVEDVGDIAARKQRPASMQNFRQGCHACPLRPHKMNVKSLETLRKCYLLPYLSNSK